MYRGPFSIRRIQSYHRGNVLNVQRNLNISDDITRGRDKFDHDKNLDLFFQTLIKNGLTTNLKKCVFSVIEIDFFGFKYHKMVYFPWQLKLQQFHYKHKKVEPQNPLLMLVDH